jgi:hypothetical protein
MQIIGECRMRANEDTLAKRHASINAGIVLYFAKVADSCLRVNVNAFADYAICANLCLLTHLCLVPYVCPISYFRLR